MQETIARIPASETVLHVTRDELRRAASDNAPAGIIFHVARCGSTLISQSLKQLDNLAVYAEPQPVNEILVPPHEWPRADMVAAIRALGSAFARHAGGPYVLKLSSWNTLFCDIVTEAFPETNWVLCLRDPVEVGVSLLQQPPGWLSSDGGGVAGSRGNDRSGRRARLTRGARGAGIRCVLRRGSAPRCRTGQTRGLRSAAGRRLGHGGSALFSSGRLPAASRNGAGRAHAREGAARKQPGIRPGCRDQAGHCLTRAAPGD